jgi:MFS transporter, DHA1 family, tetracycline resistance protein
MPRSHRSAATFFILITIILDVLALGIIIPVLPLLVLGFEGGNAVSTATVIGLFGTVWAMMQFVASPIMGALSDRFGRRPVILISNLGLGLDYVLMALAPNLAWLFIGRVISGITAASFPTAAAYIADVTPVERRAKAYGLMGAAFGIGFVIGPALGGVLGTIEPHLPFWVAAGCSLANGLYGLLVLPESLPADRREAFSWRRANPVGALVLLRSHRELRRMAWVVFLGQVAHESLPSVFVLYAGFRYGWQSDIIGWTLAAVGVCSSVVQGSLVQPCITRFGERGTLLIGLVCGCIGFTIYGLASTGWMFWLGIPVMTLWGLAGPSAQGLMSARVSPAEQGQLQCAISSLRGVSGLFSPLLFTWIFATAISGTAAPLLPGAPYLSAAILIGVSVLLGKGVRPSAAPDPGHAEGGLH